MATGRKDDGAEHADDLEENPLERLTKRTYRTLNRRLGLAAPLLVAIVIGWWQWDQVEKAPGVAWLVDHVTEWITPLPVATGDRFAIVLARLGNDPDGAHQRVLREALLRAQPEQAATEQAGIELLILDRTISVEGSAKPEEAIRAGHEQARKLLEQTHADVMIWATALDAKPDGPLSLHWTTAARVNLDKSAGTYRPQEQTDLDLPKVFWADLSDVLGLLVSTQQARFSQQQGHYLADQIKPFIERVSAILQSPKLSSDQQAPLWSALGQSLLTYGEQRGDNPSLEKALAAFREALQDYTRERVPLDWATAQNNLGNALEALGERESDTTQLTASVAAYRDALKERTRARVPLDWAATQNNLGLALAALGERESDTTLLTEAVAAYREALKERTRERVPLDWAMTQNNLGNALEALGERESDTAQLTAAVAAYREALTERTRERDPLDWAGTQNSLGCASASDTRRARAGYLTPHGGRGRVP